MTRDDVDSELSKEPFGPIRLHLSSGKVVDVVAAGTAWMLDNSLMVFHEPTGKRDRESLYDLLSLDHVERIERMA